MEKLEFLEETRRYIIDILNGQRFPHFKAQIYAKSVGAQLRETFNEDQIYADSSQLIFHACTLLIESSTEKKLAHRALKESAEVLETLAKITKKLDKDFCLILAAFCYDISGYSANAMCVVREIEEYKLTSELGIGVDEEISEPDEAGLDNTVLNSLISYLILFLKKRIPESFQIIENDKSFGVRHEKIRDGLESFLKSILRGENTDFFNKLFDAYLDSFKTGDSTLSLLLLLLLARVMEYFQKSVWYNVCREEDPNLAIWKSFARLLVNDFYKGHSVNKLKDRVSKFELWNSQIQAINSGLLTSENSYVIQMPTSCGKTLLAEMTIINEWTKKMWVDRFKCIYIAPFRALVNQVEGELNQNLSRLGIRTSSFVGSFEIDLFQDFFLNENEVLVATPEKIDLLSRVADNFLENLDLVIIDEGHLIGDSEDRGTLLELLLVKIKKKASNARFIFMSAVLPNTDSKEIAEWLAEDSNNVIETPSDPNDKPWTPTRKLIGNFEWLGDKGKITFLERPVFSSTSGGYIDTFAHGVVERDSYKYYRILDSGKQSSRPSTAKFPENTTHRSQTSAMLGYQMSEGGSTLIFTAHPQDCHNVCNALLNYFDFLDEGQREISDYFQINPDRESYKLACEWYGSDSEIAMYLLVGVGIHYGDLAKPIRRIIEREYKSGLLRLLVSTNTIGQGINFPIKNLIFHSVVIDQRHDSFRKLSVRDFWNIVGRAGRAGKETEGQVVYLTLTAKDKEYYSEYVDKSNLENAKSHFYLLFKELVESRITSEKFREKLAAHTEPTILQTLCEEVVGNEGAAHEDIIAGTLAKVQILKDPVTGPHLTYLNSTYAEVVNEVRESVDVDYRSVYSKTGLCLESCSAITQFVSDNIEELRGYVETDNSNEWIKSFMNLIFTGEFKEFYFDKLEFSKFNIENISDFVSHWVEGTPIDELVSEWEECYEDDKISKMHIFLNNGCAYLFPWGLSSFNLIYCMISSTEYDDLPESIKSIPTFVKYGVNSKYASFFMGLGVRSRETAVALSNLNPYDRFETVLKWLTNLSYEWLHNRGFGVYEIRNIMDVSLKIGVTNFWQGAWGEKINLSFMIRGIPYEENRKKVSLEVSVGDTIILERDHENSFDPYAIKVFVDGKHLGFVPRENARYLSSFIDLESKSFNVVVSEVGTKETWKTVKVNLAEV